MTVDARQNIVQWAKWILKNKRHVNYDEIRPIPQTRAFPIVTDCSGFVTLCYKLAGAKDPNGRNYNGSGYTMTLADHGTQIPVSKVAPGDIVVYDVHDSVSWQHTAVIIQGGADPLTISHGQQGDPSYVHVSQDGRTPSYYRFDTLTNKTFAPPGLVLPALPKKIVPPTAAQLKEFNMVHLANLAEEHIAHINGWSIRCWNGKFFPGVTSRVPNGFAHYADVNFKTKKPTTPTGA